MSVKQKIQDLKKDHIIDISVNHFMNNGYEKTKMNEVAKEAEVSIGTIYDFFENKEGVFKAALFKMIDVSHNVLVGMIKEINDPREKLIKQVEYKLEQMRCHKDTVSELLNSTPWFFSKLAMSDPFEKIINETSSYFQELDKIQPLRNKNFKQIAMNFKFFTESYLMLSIKESKDIDVDPQSIVDEFLYGAVK
ncbi:MAG: TetR/AcrR family transcriptional regulator [Campylobacterales bacterium]|nr:TetR/AcrR family transcriptional regulator [Campylobacterales bacterium]